MSGTEEKMESINGSTNGHSPMAGITRAETAGSFSMTPEMFERMYLTPQTKVKGQLRQTLGNPTALALAGLALSVTPLACDLMGWRGAGGNGSASIGAYFFLGGLLMFTAGILEFILGNTFPYVLFCGYGGWWLTFGATLQPFYSAYGNYSPDPSDAAKGLDTQGFAASFAFFLMSMCIFTFIMFLCALRVNVALATILLFLFIAYGVLCGAFFANASGHAAYAATLQLTGGSCLFVTAMAAWWLFFSLMMEAIDFPIQIPTFDLSTVIKGHSELKMAKGGNSEA